MALNLSGIEAFKAGLPQAIDDGIHQAAEHVGNLAQQLAPEDTGDLKKSKQVKPGDQKGKWLVTFGEGLPDERAVAQEYGTIDQPAQPYVGPALNEIDVKAEVAAKVRDLARRSRR